MDFSLSSFFFFCTLLLDMSLLITYFLLARIGTGEPSEVLNTRTKGKKPEVPEVHRFVEVSSSSITLHLNAWQDGGCPMNYFVVEYKPRLDRLYI